MSTSRTPKSERVVLAAPMSFAGSRQRIWNITTRRSTLGAISLGTVAVMLILTAWTVVMAWYLMFGLLLVPYRVMRRGQRKQKREALRHREALAAIKTSRP